ncbi:MAG: AAA family ATPase [Liquorilactobacillus hordei]|uniref:AAA family ATPase n=1 Tax=Liquorilactobacillus hordei TaxID=468911 RepID=UPI0039ECF016
MKPMQIKMTNFGPYAKQEIDFVRFTEQPLFLISGKTGSGKTTIFDAMCFALFGSTSGDDREAETMRSGFAKESELTEVEFVFEHQNKIYRIKRQPKQVIVKKRGTGTKIQNMTVLLSYQSDDGENIELSKVGLVNKFIQELIHLTAEQFTQIIMLPQGKFRNFLDSDSNEKEKLLRELFATNLFKDWTDEIQKQAKNTHSQIQEKQQEIDALKNQIIEIDTEIDVSSWLKGANEINEINKRARNTAKLKLTEIEEKISGEQNNLLKSKILLRDFETLADTKKKMIEFENDNWLEEKEKYLAELKWYRSNEQLVVKLEEQELAYTEIQAKIQKNLTEKKEVEEKLQNNEEKNQILGIREKENDLLIEEVRRLNDKKSYVKQAEQLEIELTVTENQEKTFKNQITELEKILIVGREKIEKQQEIIKSNEGISEKELKFHEIRTNLTKADEVIEQIKRSTARINKLEETLVEQRNSLAEKNSQIKIAKKKHEDLDNALAKKQIIILSRKLKKGEPCPLCGSLEHPQIMTLDKNQVEVTEDDVKKAAKKQQDLSQSSGELAGKIDSNAERITELKKNVDQELEKLRSLLDLREDSFAEIQKLVTELRLNLDKEFQNLENRKQIIKDARAEVERLMHEKLEAEEKMELLRKKEQMFKLNITKTETKLATIHAEIPDNISSMKQLEKIIVDKQQKITAFETEKQKIFGEMTELSNNLMILTERLKGLKNTSDSLEIKLRQDTEKLTKVMHNHDKNLTFTMMKTGIKEIKKFEMVESKIKDYRNKMFELKTQITDLKIRTEGKVIPDIAKLDASLLQLKKNKEEVFAEYEKISQKHSELLKVSQAVNKRWDEYQAKLKLDAQWNELLEVIGGKGKVKLGLERYVLRRYLERVLQVANIKLLNLTNERYHFEIDRNNGTYATNTGLELNIFDADLGKFRSVKTLSGGESFIAALCLALAMAEVIQSINGGTQIDALFIDEGFGALDDDSLQVALEALQTLEGKNRLIGIISHVSALREQLPAQIRIESKNGRSVAHYIFDFEEIPAHR